MTAALARADRIRSVTRRALSVLLLFYCAACGGEKFQGPLRLLDRKPADGRIVKSGALSTGGETRPALLESARYRVPLPKRGRLTFGMGLAWTASEEEAPGWYRLTVRAGEKVLVEKQLNPRALRGFRDVSVPLDGLGAQTDLALELRFTDRDGKDVAQPKDLLLGISEPTLHDLDDYGRAKGVVLVSIDTLRRDHVGAYGYSRPTTPRLDALAKEGILAEDAVSVSSWTLPAHLSMLTSVDPGVHGGTETKLGFNKRVPTLASLLKQNGYATQAVTSHLYVSAAYGLDEGFDRLDLHQDRKATETADRAIAILERLGDRPFFLFLHFYDPHWHYDPPAKQRALFDSGYKGKLSGLWQDFKDKTAANTTPQEKQHLLDLYDGEIRYTDDEVGRILDHLKASGLDQSTLVVVTSDHGEEFLEHGSWEHQKTLYEEVIRIPLALRGPGVPQRREKAQTSLLDIAPTVLAWAGLPQAPTHQGKSLLAPLPERAAYGETDHTLDGTHKLFVRSGAGRGKAILSLAPNGDTLAKEEWYDLAADPAESKDARPRDEVANSLRDKAIQRFKDGRTRGAGAPTVKLSQEQIERLRALGYIK